jgi:N6-L-threonylcarbamoyladenine synthase
MIHDDTFDMSFSGLKSSAQRLVQELGPENVQAELPHLCASFQEAVVDVLLVKLEKAAKQLKNKKIILTGGVSANSRLRARAQDLAQRKKMTLVIPPLRYCTDNAAMIGYAGILRLNRGEKSDLSLSPYPQALPEDFMRKA